MIVVLQRIENYNDYSIGTLHVNGVLMSFTLEDEQRSVKMWGKTRIPAGIYPIKLRTTGSIHEGYKKRFPWHKGVLHIQDVPNFEWIYLHIGNNDLHTAGCPLVGNSHTVGRNHIGESTINYEKLYKMILPALLDGENVFIVVRDEIE
jgi:hypothetical protein